MTKKSESRPTGRKATLTREETQNWAYYARWYKHNGWAGADAERNAWYDLLQKYPRLTRFAACSS